VTHEVAQFVSGINITADERHALECIIKLASIVILLTNDYYSYRKEYIVYVREGSTNRVYNLV